MSPFGVQAAEEALSSSVFLAVARAAIEAVISQAALFVFTSPVAYWLPRAAVKKHTAAARFPTKQEPR